jgi:thiol-disulfide isomerase/thioredoxin
MRFTAQFVIFALIAGCSSDQPKPVPVSEAVKSIDLIDVSFVGLDRAIADERGKVVLIDIWATWCDPCVKEFPKLVDFHAKYSSKGLACISVSTDSSEDREKALEFLKSNNAAFANYRLSESNANISKELNEKYPTDQQPVLILFDRAGNKVATFFSKAERSPENIEKVIQEHLARTP